MILCDAGPLLAILDPGQGENHRRCVDCLATIREPLVTTWHCVTEAMHLAHRAGRWPMQALMLKLLASDEFLIHQTGKADVARMHVLMEQYRNVPMDLADAALMAAAEDLRIR